VQSLPGQKAFQPLLRADIGTLNQLNEVDAGMLGRERFPCLGWVARCRQASDRLLEGVQGAPPPPGAFVCLPSHGMDVSSGCYGGTLRLVKYEVSRGYRIHSGGRRGLLAVKKCIAPWALRSVCRSSASVRRRQPLKRGPPGGGAKDEPIRMYTRSGPK
jgi:hypothetical protein